MKSRQAPIQHCRICGATELNTVILLPDMPLTDDFVTGDQVGEEFLGDIDIALCAQCGCAQNRNNTDMADYYNDYTYTVQSSGFAITFMSTLARRIKDRYFAGQAAPRVIEIGSGSGEQLLEFKKLGFRVLGVEPSKKLADYANSIGIPTLHAFFDEHTAALLPAEFSAAELIVSSYTFDHIPQPVSVLQTIHALLSTDGIMVHEVHDLELIRQRNEYCLFEHEHYTYLNERTMAHVVSTNGFNVDTFLLLSQQEKRANSLLVAARKVEQAIPLAVDVGAEAAALLQLSRNVQASIGRISAWLAANQGQRIVAYGAGGRGVMTIAALPDCSGLAYVVDKNPKAEQICTPKSHLPVFGIERLGVERADRILVFSFGYYQEIVQELGQRYGYHPDQFLSVLDLLEVSHG